MFEAYGDLLPQAKRTHRHLDADHLPLSAIQPCLWSSLLKMLLIHTRIRLPARIAQLICKRGWRPDMVRWRTASMILSSWANRCEIATPPAFPTTQSATG